MKLARPRRLALSLLQVMKLVVFAAVAFACVAPMLHLWQVGVVQAGTATGLIVVALFEGIAVPLVWAGLSFALIRRGPWRDRLITAFLLGSVAVALGVGSWLLVAFAIPDFLDTSRPADRRLGVSALALHVGVILALAAAMLFLSLRLRRRAHPGTSPIRGSDDFPAAVPDPSDLEAQRSVDG